MNIASIQLSLCLTPIHKKMKAVRKGGRKEGWYEKGKEKDRKKKEKEKCSHWK